MRKAMRTVLLGAALPARTAGAALVMRPLSQPMGPADGSAALGLMLEVGGEGDLYVLAVAAGSTADQAGILPGDRLVQAEDTPLADVAVLDALIRREDVITLCVRRDGSSLTIELPCK